MNMNKFFLAAFALLLAVLPSCGSLGKIVRGGASGVKSGYNWVTSSTPADKQLESSEKDNKKPVLAAEKEAKAASDEVTMMTKKEGENSPEAVEARNKLAIAKIGVTQAKVDFLRKQALLAKTAEETLSQTVKDTSGDEKSTAITQWNKVNSKIESYDKQLIEAAKEYGKTLNTLPAGFTGRTEIVVDEDSEKLGHNDPRLEPFVNPAKAIEMAKSAEAEAAAKKATPAAPKTAPATPVEATEKKSEEPANPPTAGVTPTAAPTKVPAIAVATPTLNTEAAGTSPAASAAVTTSTPKSEPTATPSVTPPSSTTPTDSKSVGGEVKDDVREEPKKESEPASLVVGTVWTPPPPVTPPAPEQPWTGWFFWVSVVVAVLITVALVVLLFGFLLDWKKDKAVEPTVTV